MTQNFWSFDLGIGNCFFGRPRVDKMKDGNSFYFRWAFLWFTISFYRSWDAKRA